jgi:hypothetical protein
LPLPADTVWPYTGGVSKPESTTPASVDGQVFSFAELDEKALPTRADDTVVISGGRRATRAEVLAHIAADAASRGDG